MEKTFIKGALYASPSLKNVLRFVEMAPFSNPRFEDVAGSGLVAYGHDEPFPGTVGFGSRYKFEEYKPAFLWSDLLTPADLNKAARLIDPLNGRFEGEILRHLAAKRAKRAKLRKLTAILGGEYYAAL